MTVIAKGHRLRMKPRTQARENGVVGNSYVALSVGNPVCKCSFTIRDLSCSLFYESAVGVMDGSGGAGDICIALLGGMGWR